MLNSILFSSNTNIDFFGDFQLMRDYLPIGGSAPLKFAMLISKSRISGCLGGKNVILKDSVIQSEWVAWVDKKEGANVIITISRYILTHLGPIIYDSKPQEDNKLTFTIRRRGDSNQIRELFGIGISLCVIMSTNLMILLLLIGSLYFCIDHHSIFSTAMFSLCVIVSTTVEQWGGQQMGQPVCINKPWYKLNKTVSKRTFLLNFQIILDSHCCL